MSVGPPLRTLAIVGITLTALALGGSTELWAQGAVVLLAALIIFLFPPRVALGRTPTVVPLGLMALALAAFLPASWGIEPVWRRHLIEVLHAPLGYLRTPQPWLTFQACGLLFFGLIWAYYLLAQEWTPSERSMGLRLLAGGVTLLAAVTIVTYLTGYRVPGWNQEENRGWFPNRNQTADVLALGGIIVYAVTSRHLQRKHWVGGVWLIGLALICVALVISYSRAGIVMFFAGVGLWQLGSFFERRKGRQMAFGLPALLMILSLFLLFGGTTLGRFFRVVPPQEAYAGDYRILIQEDAVKVSLQAPILGAGLGNFEPVFTALRQLSADQNRTLHPESDWLWMMVEMGWPAPILLLGGLNWWLRRCLPFAAESGESLRRAAMVAFLAFIAHGLVDVSGHRLGSLMVGLFMAGIALSPKPRRVVRRWIAPLFRGLALLAAALGIWWLASALWKAGPPTTATIVRLEDETEQASDDGRLASMAEAAHATLEVAPLDWAPYFRLATADAFRTDGTDAAVNDFAIARFLEPHWINLCVNEGKIWLAAGDTGHCLEAWEEALRRAGGARTETFETLLAASRDNPEVHRGLEATIGDEDDNDRIAFLNYATPEEVKTELDRWLARDPNLHRLDSYQLSQLFAAWSAHGDADALAAALVAHPDWQMVGWPFLAQHFAAEGDFELATLTALKFLPIPAMGDAPSGDKTILNEPLDPHSTDLFHGLQLCRAQLDNGRLDEALATIATLKGMKKCPTYIHYLEAQVCVKKRDWEQAWAALQQFAGM